MIEIDDYVEVPYLQEILNYMPINPIDDEDVLTYIQNITNVILVNYRYEQYQFSYFGVHLLYMTYIYCVIWKIGQILPDRYCDAVIFARPYSGREKDLDMENISSIFNYSLMPEKDISKAFKIIGLDKSQITNVGGLVDIRNDMAHASGKFEILTEESFGSKANAVLTSMRNIHNSMDSQIRMWFQSMLQRYSEDEFVEYENTVDLIEEQMIQKFKLSINDLLICKEMSLKDIITKNRDKKELYETLKNAVTDYCSNLGYE